MVFSSIIFIFYFLPILLAVYYFLPKKNHKNIFLFLASLVFYAFGAGRLLVLLLLVSFCAWFFSFLISKTKQKKLFAYLAVISLLLVLIYYKYLGFIIDNLIYAGVEGLPGLKIILPAGLSFFIFQAVSYTIDVYRKNNRFEKNPLYVMLYICMFPQLISGPLVRYHQLQEQLRKRIFSFSGFSDGIRRFIIGLAKKVLIANPLSLLVAQIMDTDITLISPPAAWLGIIAFALQLFFDFSGYTDMAIGIGKMLGFDLPENFNFPYISRSITEFWRRWHMTLSAWLRDYLFMPLSLSMRRWGNAGVFIALFVTFTICGMWHGATWNFIIWGVIQGIFLGMEQLFLGKYISKLKGFSVVYAMLIVLTGFVFVRTASLADAGNYLKAMFTPGEVTPLGLNVFLTKQYLLLIPLSILFSIPLKIPERLQGARYETMRRTLNAVLLAAIFLLSLMAVVTETYNPFIYFRF